MGGKMGTSSQTANPTLQANQPKSISEKTSKRRHENSKSSALSKRKSKTFSEEKNL